MNLFNTKTPIEPTNPQGFDCIKQQQYNQELTLADHKSYIPITTCLFEAIVRDYSSQLLPRDIILFIQLLNLYSASLNKKQKTIIYSSEKLAKLLGYKAKDKNNMRSIVLRIVKKLEQLGLLNVTRHKDKKGSDKVNEIVPILPDRLYDKIKYEPSNFNLNNGRLKYESNIQHILRTKLFTPIDLEFIRSLFDDTNITATHKLFYLNCIITAYQNYQTTGKLSFAATAKELMSSNNISRATLFNILNFIKNQYPDYFIEVGHSYSKSDDIDSNRYDKSTFIISINPIVIPKSFCNKNNKKHLEVQKAIDQTKTLEAKVEYIGIDNADLVADNETAKSDTYQLAKTGVQIWKPSSLNLEAHNNKEIIIKISNKNIDESIDKNLDEKNAVLDTLEKNNQIKPPTFLQTSHTEDLESELCSLSSKSLKNSIKDFMDSLPSLSNSNAENASSTIQDIFDRENKKNITNSINIVIPKNKASKAKARNDRKHCREHKDFRYFYPISEEESSMLNFKANREFCTNFTNQLLLKLYIKYPEKRFKNRFTFLSYMVKALKKEKHQGPLVNHTSFRFSCNIGTEEQHLLEYEKYLSQIENSFDISYEMQVKKKIAGRFSTKIAYAILTGVEFKLNPDNSFITALIPSSLALSERQIVTLSEQLEAVYGINGYYVAIVTASKDLANVQATSKDSPEEPEEMYINTKECSMQQGMLLSAIPSTSAWHGIRQDLIAELGKDIDNSWFSKALVTEARETNLLTLTMPNKFMSDFIKSRYGYAISRISGNFGFKHIEYNY